MELPHTNLFPALQNQSTIERDYGTEHRPLTLLNSENYIQFEFSVAENEFVKFNETYLYVKMKVECPKGETPEWTSIYPTNYFLNSLFKQVTVSVNGVQITENMTNFMYKSYLEALLAYSEDAKSSHLSSAFWESDEAKRCDLLNSGKDFEMLGRLHLDLTHQPRGFPGPCNILIKLDLNAPEFLFKSAKNKPFVKFTDVTLNVTRCVLSPQALKAYKTKHHKTSAHIPFSRTYVRAIPIKTKTLDEQLEDVCRGRMPRKLYFTMVSNKAYNGDLKEDPFKLSHYNLTYFAAYIDGVQYPTQAFKPDFKTGMCKREYMGLFRALGQNNTDSYARISFEDFKSNYPILAVEFEPDLGGADCFGDIVNPAREGSLRIELKFAEALAEAVTAIVYLEFDGDLEIDSNNVVKISR